MPPSPRARPRSSCAPTPISTPQQWHALKPLLALFPEAGDAVSYVESFKGVVGPETDAVSLDPGAFSRQTVVGLTQPQDPAKLQATLITNDPPLVSEEVAGWHVIAHHRATIDRFKRARNEGTLASSSAYKEATDGLPAQAVATVYVDGAALTEALDSPHQDRHRPDSRVRPRQLARRRDYGRAGRARGARQAEGRRDRGQRLQGRAARGGADAGLAVRRRERPRRDPRRDQALPGSDRAARLRREAAGLGPARRRDRALPRRGGAVRAPAGKGPRIHARRQGRRRGSCQPGARPADHTRRRGLAGAARASSDRGRARNEVDGGEDDALPTASSTERSWSPPSRAGSAASSSRARASPTLRAGRRAAGAAQLPEETAGIVYADVQRALPLLQTLAGAKPHDGLAPLGNGMLWASVDGSVLTVKGSVAVR